MTGKAGSPYGQASSEWDTPRLAEGVELFGQYQGSGYTDPPYLIRRSDGRVVEVSWLLNEVAVALNGERGPGEVARIVSARVDRNLTEDDVAFLIEKKLRPLGLLADLSGCQSRADGPSPTLALSVRRAVVPRATVQAFTTLFRPLFLPPVVAAAVVGLAAVDVWLLRRGGVERGLQEVAQRPSLVLLIVVLTLVGAALHEFGHAAATRYGGAEPGVIGIGVYLVWPVFYNDLNDSYRLSRRGRLRADLGGVYFNALFILLLTFAYAVSGFEPILAVVAIQHLAIVQQFLPFVRLDGYYVVSDIAGVPDLFRSSRSVVSSLVPGRKSTPGPGNLRPGPKWLIRVWVLVSVPLVVACVAWFVIRLPHLIALVFATSVAHGRGLASAWRTGAVDVAAVSVLQLVLLALPAIGLSAAAINMARNLFRRLSMAKERGRGRRTSGESRSTRVVMPASGLAEGSVHREEPVPTAALQVGRDDLDPSDCWLHAYGIDPAGDWAEELDPADVWSTFVEDGRDEPSPVHPRRPGAGQPVQVA